MKSLLTLAFVMAGSSAFAQNTYTYKCLSADRFTEAELSVMNDATTTINWSEPAHDSSSEGRFLNIDQAPYSTEKGYSVFTLVDFYKTNDSYYAVALSPGFEKGAEKITAAFYFDNDDHKEEQQTYDCQVLR